MRLDGESGLGRALEKFRPLCGKRVALLEANGLNLARLDALRSAFELAGAEVVLVAPSGASSAIKSSDEVLNTNAPLELLSPKFAVGFPVTVLKTPVESELTE